MRDITELGVVIGDAALKIFEHFALRAGQTVIVIHKVMQPLCGSWRESVLDLAGVLFGDIFRQPERQRKEIHQVLMAMGNFTRHSLPQPGEFDSAA